MYSFHNALFGRVMTSEKAKGLLSFFMAITIFLVGSLSLCLPAAASGGERQNPQNRNIERRYNKNMPGADKSNRQSSPKAVRLPGGKVERDLVYATVNGQPLTLDIHRPEGGGAAGPLPLIVWIHGGGFRSGSKEQCHPALMLLSRGYAVASINYRLSGEAIFPAQIEDCKAAVRWLRSNAGKYGLDPDQFGVWGASAGGLLAALVGTTGNSTEFSRGDNLEASSRVKAVCVYYGPTDLVKMAAPTGARNRARADSPESLLLGGPVLEKKELAARANPINYLTTDTPPFLIVHGTKDAMVSPDQSQMLYDALTKGGIPAQLYWVENAKHGGPEFLSPTVIDQVGAFFAKHLKGTAPPRQNETGNPLSPNKIEQTDGQTKNIVATEVPSNPDQSPAIPQSSPGGLLYFASYQEQDNPTAVSNPYLAGALLTIYWSEVEASDGIYTWEALERRIQRWTKAGKRVALRVMWSSNGLWQDPLARHPTPQWVLDKGAAIAFSEATRTQVPIPWDPVYKKYAGRFVEELARKFDGNSDILFIDITPGAETNPYRAGINRSDPLLKARFLRTAASDGQMYSNSLWLATVKEHIDMVSGVFKRTKPLITLNVGGIDGPSRLEEIGNYSVAKGCYVGQNGLKAASYLKDSNSRRNFLEWGKKTKIYFEMLTAADFSDTGPLIEVVKAFERIKGNFLGVYAIDCLQGTRGHGRFDPKREEALAYGAKLVAPSGTPTPSTPNNKFLEKGAYD